MLEVPWECVRYLSSPGFWLWHPDKGEGLGARAFDDDPPHQLHVHEPGLVQDVQALSSGQHEFDKGHHIAFCLNSEA